MDDLERARADRRRQKLGMPQGTACNRLVKMILFDLAKRLELTACFRCGHQIESRKEFTIEHMADWEYSDNPQAIFFDLDNISFSHHRCNVGHAARKRRIHATTTDEYKAEYARLKAQPEKLAVKMAEKKRHRANRRANGLPIDVRLPPVA